MITSLLLWEVYPQAQPYYGRIGDPLIIPSDCEPVCSEKELVRMYKIGILRCKPLASEIFTSLHSGIGYTTASHYWSYMLRKQGSSMQPVFVGISFTMNRVLRTDCDRGTLRPHAVRSGLNYLSARFQQWGIQQLRSTGARCCANKVIQCAPYLLEYLSQWIEPYWPTVIVAHCSQVQSFGYRWHTEKQEAFCLVKHLYSEDCRDIIYNGRLCITVERVRKHIWVLRHHR